MERNNQGQYSQHYKQQQGSGGGMPYPWAQNGMMAQAAGQPPYRGHPPPPSPQQPPVPSSTSANMYYNQAQSNQNNQSSYTGSSGAQQQPYQHPQGYPQYGQQMNSVNPWAQFNQPPPYTPNVSGANKSNDPVQAPPPQPYNQYMYPPPTSSTGHQNPSNQAQGQNMSYPYYQMQQQPPNYYYQNNQMYPNGVPPPPLPESKPPPPLPPPSTKVKEESGSSTSTHSSSNSRENPSSSSSRHRRDESTSSKSTDDKKPSKDTKVPEEEKGEKETKKAVPIMVGKRRGGRVLPTGVVKKQKVDDKSSKGKSDAWSQYMAEVRRYKDQSCTEERQNRPLVK